MSENNPCTLILLRGVSGSGKSTLAGFLKRLSPWPHDRVNCVTTDDFFELGLGGAPFSDELLDQAHQWCQSIVRSYLEQQDGRTIIVHNTNTIDWEMKPYLDMAEKHGARVFSMIVEGRHGGTDVPDPVLKGQKGRLRKSPKLR